MLVKSVSDCQAGDVIACDVYNNQGIKLLSKRTEFTEVIRQKLLDMGITQVKVCNSRGTTTNTTEQRQHKISETYSMSELTIKQLLNGLVCGNKLDLDLVKNVCEDIYAHLAETHTIINHLRQVRTVDDYTFQHCLNTAFYSMLIGKWVGLSAEEIKEVIKAGLLHDLGKVWVPNDYLKKPGILSKSEYKEITKHSLYGYSEIISYDGLSTKVKKAILMHHERVDGSGYPFNLKGNDIEFYARVVAVADVYDAITSDRVYKSRATPFDAFRVFLNTGLGAFDPVIVQQFLNNISIYYVGTEVCLSDGRRGLIAYIPPNDIVNPIIQTRDGLIDLAKDETIAIDALIA